MSVAYAQREDRASSDRPFVVDGYEAVATGLASVSLARAARWMRSQPGRARAAGAKPSRVPSACLSCFLALVIQGCSLLFDFAVQQCAIHEDCTELGSGLVCRQALCVPACERHSDCPDSETACVEGTCLSLSAPNCSVLDTDTGRRLTDGAVLIGAVLRREVAASDAVEREALKRAARELNAGASRAGRGVAVVTCATDDTANQVAATDEAATHLLTNLKVRLLLLDLPGDGAADFFRRHIDSSREAVVVATGTARAADTPVSSEDMLWYLGGREDELAQALALTLYEYKRATRPDEEMVIAVIESQGSKAEERILEGMKSALLNTGITVQSKKVSDKASVQLLLEELEVLPPDAMVVLSPTPEAEELLHEADDRLPPLVVLAPELQYLTPESKPAIPAERLAGLRWTAPAATAALRDFGREVQKDSGKRTITDDGTFIRSTAPAHYDALYLLAYTAFDATRSSRAQLANADLVPSLRRFLTTAEEPSGAVTPTGADHLDASWSGLGSGEPGSLLMQGLTGPMWFWPSDGARRNAVVGLWCRSPGTGGQRTVFDGARIGSSSDRIEFLDDECAILRCSDKQLEAPFVDGRCL